MVCRSQLSKWLIVGFFSGSFAFGICNSPVGRGGIKCRVQGATDTDQSGLTAFRFLVPDGWKANTSFRWLPPNNTAFASDLSLSTPDLHSMVDCVEHMVMTYMSGFGSQPG